jgi:hypothetical protein
VFLFARPGHRRARALALVLALSALACGTTSVPRDGAVDAAADAGTNGPSLGGQGGDPLGPGDASTAHRVTLLFATTCAGGPELDCHGNHAGGLSLLLTPDGGDVIGVPSSEAPALLRVKPGDPSRSYLYRKVLEDGGVVGARMPLGGAYDPRLEALLRAWIEAGAPVDP